MNIYFDENLPSKLAEGLNILQQLDMESQKLDINVTTIKDVFGTGAADEDWLPEVGKEEGCVFTQDINIHRTRHQRQLCDEYDLGMFFFRPPSKSGFNNWDLVKLMVKHWEEIVKLSKKTNRPFAYRISSRGEIQEL